MVYASALDSGARRRHRRFDCYSAHGDGHFADAAIDDGVRLGTPAATTAATATAPAAGRSAKAGDGCEPVGGAGRGSK